MDDREYFKRLFETLSPKLLFPTDRRANNAWQVYEPSFLTQIFDSEKYRQFYAEAFRFKPTNVPKLPAHLQPPNLEVFSLKDCVLKFLLNEYKRGPFHSCVIQYDKVYVGENLSVEAPVQDIVDLDNNVFWKRVAEAKCKDKLLLENCQRDYNFNWKNLAIEAKLQEIFETTKRESWNEENMEVICKAVCPYVRNLKVDQLIPLEESVLEKHPYNPLYKQFNYPPKDCHHGNLGAALRYLIHLETLSVQYGLKKVLYSYQQRKFEVSYQDIANLSSALSSLDNIKKLIIKNSRLDDRKCKILIEGIVNSPLESLSLISCSLGNDSATSIGHYLLHSGGTLRELELCDNNISGEALKAIGYALQSYKGELEYIGLAGNPIFESGVVAIGSGICGLEQVKRMDLSRCTVDGDGNLRIIQIVGFHQRLVWLNLSAIHIGPVNGDKLVEALFGHFNLEFLEVRGCDLTENQQRKIRMLINRNIFYKANPCMKRDYFTDEDIARIDEWVVKNKHPLLLRILDRTDSTESFNQDYVRKRVDVPNVPAFVPKSQRNVQSSTAILKSSYLDCFGADSEVRLFNDLDSSEILYDINELDNPDYNPNEYNLQEFVSDVTTGHSVILDSRLYFNK